MSHSDEEGLLLKGPTWILNRVGTNTALSVRSYLNPNLTVSHPERFSHYRLSDAFRS